MRHVSFDRSKQDLRNGNGNIQGNAGEKDGNIQGNKGENDGKKKIRKKARKGRKPSSSASEDDGSVIRKRLWRKLVEDDCKSSGTDVTFTSTYSNQSNISVVELPPDFRAVIFIWSFSLVYALFDDQLMSKEPLDKCNLASDLPSQLHISSVLMALVVPFILGPLLSTLIDQVVVFLEQRKVVIRRSPSQISICSQSSSSSSFLGILSLLHLLCCGTHMIVADWLFPDRIDIFSYMLLKYCVGFLFLLVFPLAVLSCHSEVATTLMYTILLFLSQIWRETVRIFRASGGKKEQTREEKEAEIGKQMLDFSR